MATTEDYVARIEETCGEEKDFIATFKYEKKDEIIKKILERAKKEKSLSSMIFELTFKGISFRLYVTGKAIFRNLKTKEDVRNFLADLLS
jgi:hypothetical protein